MGHYLNTILGYQIEYHTILDGLGHYMRNLKLVLLFKLRVGTHTYGARPPPFRDNVPKNHIFFF